VEEPIKTWIDDLPEHMATEADLADLFTRVDALRAKREAIERASRNNPMKISAIDPLTVVCMCPVRPCVGSESRHRQMRLFPEPRKKSLPLVALELLGTACVVRNVHHVVDITEQFEGTAVIITGARLPAK